MVIYNVQSNGEYNQLVIELINDTIYIDAESVTYITGNINVDAKEDSLHAKISSYFIDKSAIKQKFKGTGKIYMYATLGSYHKFSIKNGEELYINPKVFMACRDSIQLVPKINFSIKNFLSGTPMLTMLVKGNGSIMVLMPGPVQEFILKDEKFIAIGHEVAAYSTNIRPTRQIIGKSWITAPKMAQVYRGTGNLFFSPIPNKDSKSRIYNKS